jgi:hypothetical protein
MLLQYHYDIPIDKLNWCFRSLEKLTKDGFMYPCFLMRLDKVLALDKLEPHQTHLRRGDLSIYKPGMEVIFISHQVRLVPRTPN